MKPGDMNQVEDWDLEAGWAWRSMLCLGIASLCVLLYAFLIGVFFGYLIWGM